MPPPTRITSRQHAVVKRFRQAAAHATAGEILLDGEHLVADALRADALIDVLVTDGGFPALAGRARSLGAHVYEATTAVIEAASPVRTPSGIIALARWSPIALRAALDGAAPCVLGLCRVQDPGNVGSIIRAADAFGATAVLALDGSAHPGGWKTLRGAMGSTFRVPIALGASADALAEARARGLRVVATVATGGAPPADVDLRQPTMLLLGGEGAGLSDELVAQCDARLTIPMRAGVESLNVAATAAVLLYEIARQRAPQTAARSLPAGPRRT